MEYLIGALLSVFGIAFLYFRSKGDFSIKAREHERKDAKLEKEQDSLQKNINSLNARLKSVEEKAKKLTPKQIEDYWNKKK